MSYYVDIEPVFFLGQGSDVRLVIDMYVVGYGPMTVVDV